MTERQNDIITELMFIVSPQIIPHCGPIFIATSLNSAVGTVKANGGFSLLDTGKKKILVTCDHVLTEFEEARRKRREAFLGVCLDKGNPLELDTKHVLCRDSKLDLATFDLESMLPYCTGRKFYNMANSPAPKARTGDRLVFQGYPGGRRTGDAEGLKFGRVTFNLSVADTSGYNILADVSKVHRVGDHALPPSGDPYGGCSGSPVFLMRPEGTLRLVGITTEYGLNTLMFVHAACIKPDGMIYDATQN